MLAHRLIRHPRTPSTAIEQIDVELVRARRGARISYRLSGRPARVKTQVYPVEHRPARRDGLWRSTCCEVYVRDADGPAYCEYNFAPSGDWAAYRFSGYRAGVEALEIDAPRITLERSSACFVLHATLYGGPLGAGAPSQRIALACVVETDDELSYWALAHPPGRPDFHHPLGFAAAVGIIEPDVCLDAYAT